MNAVARRNDGAGEGKKEVGDRWFMFIVADSLAIFIDIRKGVFDILKFLRLAQPNDLIGRLRALHRLPFSIYVDLYELPN